MATGKQLNLSILLKAIDQATGPIKKLNGQLQAMNAPVKRLSFEMNKFASLSGLSAVKSGLADVGREVSSLGLKLAGLSLGAGFLFKREFVDTAAEFETLQASLESIEGSSEKAKQTLAWITDFAKRTPLELSGVTKSYMLLKNAGIDPTNGTLQALVDQNAKVGGSQENMIEITRQLGQSWMKNKLQMEEVNVLTERMVPVVGLLSRAFGKSEKEVMEAIGKGKIGREAIIKLMRQMAKESAGASEKQSRTWEGMTSTLSDNWQIFKKTIMDAGPFDFLKSRLAGLNQLLERLQTPEGLKQARELGKKLEQGFLAAEAGAKKLWAQIEDLADRVGGFGNLAKIALGGIAAILAGPLLMGIGTLSLAIVQLGAGLAVALGPWGIVLAAVAAAIGVVYAHWDDLVKLYQSTVTTITDGIESTVGVFKGLADVIRNGIGSAIEWITGKWRGFMDATAGIRRIFGFIGGHIGAQIGGGPAPKFPGSERVATPSPFTGRGAPPTSKADVGGSINIRIDQDGRARVGEVKSANPRVPIDVDAGLLGAAW